MGIGYVGLPLSLSFARKYKVIAYDSNIKRISELQKSKDINKEFTKKFYKNKKIFLLQIKKRFSRLFNLYSYSSNSN